MWTIMAIGRRQMNARVFCNPPNVSAGISLSPCLTRIQEVDQMNTTANAIRIANGLELLLLTAIELLNAG
jgi:hypothetical protein